MIAEKMIPKDFWMLTFVWPAAPVMYLFYVTVSVSVPFDKNLYFLLDLLVWSDWAYEQCFSIVCLLGSFKEDKFKIQGNLKSLFLS